jgi:Fe2+ or Zn2+ uptake regulation protein
MVKRKREEKKETKAVEPEKSLPKLTQDTLESFLDFLKAQGKPSTSREISDWIGIKDADCGRALVRRAMTQLAEQGKVKITKEGNEYRYSVA